MCLAMKGNNVRKHACPRADHIFSADSLLKSLWEETSATQWNREGVDTTYIVQLLTYLCLLNPVDLGLLLVSLLFLLLQLLPETLLLWLGHLGHVNLLLFCACVQCGLCFVRIFFVTFFFLLLAFFFFFIRVFLITV